MSRARSPSPASSMSSRSRTLSPRPSPDPEAEACPFLIRVFVTKNKQTPMIDFDDGKLPVQDEFQVYGWKHSTPTSIIQQLYSVFPAPYRSPLARYAFKHVYVDASERGLYRGKDLVTFTGRDFAATVSPQDQNGNGDGDVAMDRELDEAAAPRRGRVVEEKTLDSYGFLTGDLLSVAIHIPEPRAPAATSIRGASAREREGRDRDRDRDRDGFRDARNGAPSSRDGPWARGAPLPPQAFGGDRDRDDHRAPAGSWRGGAPRGAVGSRGNGGGRRPSPDWGRRNRSQSPDRNRRETWASRRERD